MAGTERPFCLLGKKKDYSGSSCTAPGCTNTSGKDKKAGITRSYYSFPHADSKRLKLWLDAIPREGGWLPTKHSCICSDHFLGGKKSKDVGSAGYVPSIFTGADKLRGKKEARARQTKTSATAGIAALPVKRKAAATTTSAPAKVGRPAAKPADGSVPHQEVWRQTGHDYLKTTIDPKDPGPENRPGLKEDNDTLKAKVAELENKIISPDSIRDDEFPVWTGLPNKAVFDVLCKHLEPRSKQIRHWHGSDTMKSQAFVDSGATKKPGAPRKLPFRHELFIVMAKMKTGQSNRELKKPFGVSVAYMSDLLTTYAVWLSFHLKNLFEMPQVEMAGGVPHCFTEYDNLAVVLDCTEVPVQKSSNLQTKKETYSNYKGRETLKFLVGLSPNQTVNFVSPAWGGRASDKHITVESEALLKALPPGCSVMTDRGFNITEELKKLGVELIIPCFKGRGRAQMTRSELEESEHIAESRIHVERIIQRIRTFKILERQAKLNMQNIYSEVFTCCAYLVNFQLPIVKSVREY